MNIKSKLKVAVGTIFTLASINASLGAAGNGETQPDGMRVSERKAYDDAQAAKHAKKQKNLKVHSTNDGIVTTREGMTEAPNGDRNFKKKP